MDPGLQVRWRARDGEHVQAGAVLGEVRGPARSLLTAERTALNFLQRMSGIATATAAMVQEVQVLPSPAHVPALRRTHMCWHSLHARHSLWGVVGVMGAMASSGWQDVTFPYMRCRDFFCQVAQAACKQGFAVNAKRWVPWLVFDFQEEELGSLLSREAGVCELGCGMRPAPHWTAVPALTAERSSSSMCSWLEANVHTSWMVTGRGMSQHKLLQAGRPLGLQQATSCGERAREPTRHLLATLSSSPFWGR